MSISSLQGTITDAHGNTSDVKLSGKLRVTGLSSGGSGTSTNLGGVISEINNVKTDIENGNNMIESFAKKDGLDLIDKMILGDKFYSAYPASYFNMKELLDDESKQIDSLNDDESDKNICFKKGTSITINTTVTLTNCNVFLNGGTLTIESSGSLRLKGNTTIFGGRIVVKDYHETGALSRIDDIYIVGDSADQSDVKLFGILFEFDDGVTMGEGMHCMEMINIGNNVRNIEINYCKFEADLNETTKNIYVISDGTTN